MKRTVSLVLAFTFLFALITEQVFLAEEITPQRTVISGVAGKITCAHDKELKRTVTVAPSNGGRTVRLQKYSSKTGKYKTVKSYKTDDADTAAVTVTFPKDWRRRRTGRWRILVPATETAEKAVKEITVTTTNIVNKNLSAASACIYCIEDAQLIYGKNIRKRRKQASTTKIMTAIVMLDSGKLNSDSKISKNALNIEGSKLNLRTGDICSNRSLLYALLLPSSNGAAIALAESTGGSEKAFAKLMNKKAKEIGLEDSHFVTPHGLDKKNHYSSALDVSLAMSYIYPKSAIFRKVIATSKYTFKSKKYGTKRTVYTTDKLKGYSPKHKGGKTGYTSKAGYCFCGVYEHEGKTYVVTVLHSSSFGNRWSDMKKLYSYIDKYADSEY